jgi:N-acetyl-gamma-glutamyl-phosphate reductase
MDRGILSTIYAVPAKKLTTAKLVALYQDFYDGEPFIRVLPEGTLPSTAFVRGSNFCDIAPLVDSRTGRIIIVSAIDNLVKGASGQAIQNMNIVCGFPETMGLEGVGVFP